MSNQKTFFKLIFIFLMMQPCATSRFSSCISNNSSTGKIDIKCYSDPVGDLEDLLEDNVDPTQLIESLTIYNLTGNIPDNSFIKLNITNLIIPGATQLSLSENTFKECTSLKTITINYAELSFLPSKMFLNTPDLELLDLEHNNFSSIKASYFQGLRNLKTLLLSNNFLTKLDINSFRGLNKLTTLSLSYNNISRIGEKTFNSLHQLKSLYLNNNLIAKMENETFSKEAVLNTFSIKNNPISCTCSMQWFEEWLRARVSNTSYKEEVICSGPENVTNIPISDVNFKDGCTDSTMINVLSYIQTFYNSTKSTLDSALIPTNSSTLITSLRSDQTSSTTMTTHFTTIETDSTLDTTHSTPIDQITLAILNTTNSTALATNLTSYQTSSTTMATTISTHTTLEQTHSTPSDLTTLAILNTTHSTTAGLTTLNTTNSTTLDEINSSTEEYITIFPSTDNSTFNKLQKSINVIHGNYTTEVADTWITIKWNIKEKKEWVICFSLTDLHPKSWQCSLLSNRNSKQILDLHANQTYVICIKPQREECYRQSENCYCFVETTINNKEEKTTRISETDQTTRNSEFVTKYDYLSQSFPKVTFNNIMKSTSMLIGWESDSKKIPNKWIICWKELEQGNTKTNNNNNNNNECLESNTASHNEIRNLTPNKEYQVCINHNNEKCIPYNATVTLNCVCITERTEKEKNSNLVTLAIVAGIGLLLLIFLILICLVFFIKKTTKKSNVYNLQKAEKRHSLSTTV